MGETWARVQAPKPKLLMSMVGGRGIEPLTPSMSRKCSPKNFSFALRTRNVRLSVNYSVDRGFPRLEHLQHASQSFGFDDHEQLQNKVHGFSTDRGDSFALCSVSSCRLSGAAGPENRYKQRITWWAL